MKKKIIGLFMKKSMIRHQEVKTQNQNPLGTPLENSIADCVVNRNL